MKGCVCPSCDRILFGWRYWNATERSMVCSQIAFFCWVLWGN